MILEIFLAITVLALFVIVVKYVQLRMSFDQKIKEWISTYDKSSREDAILRSSRTLSGKTLERLIPFLKDFEYDPHDIRWMGDPIDFVIFDGNSSEHGPKQIVFCEVKSGDSKLSKDQNRIKELIENRKVKWYEFKIEK
ncbi:MAG: hypothetical protein HYW22_02420 [Candidatus Aenigmarchaeota archaeon]|nr:hypothetical protein [Candidatus Aenigmarchaeota archaeon]